MKKNVVRVLALVLVALMCLSLVPLAAHAEAHVHEMAEDHQDPTCVGNGFNQTYCPICGATFSMEYIPATGIHSFMNVVDEQYLILEGDCEHAYQYWKSCSVCQQSAEEAYAKALDELYEDLNNRKNSGEQADWEQVVKDRVLLLDEKYKFSYGGEGHHYIHVDHQEATCTSDGWKEYSYCDVCGEYFNYEVIPAKGHRWGEYTQTKAPTCTEAGEKVRVCEVCDEKDVVVLPALGHAWGEFKVTKEATCTEDGSRERVCSVCNEKEIQVIPAAHKFGEYVVTLEPTCFVDGSRERTCTVCGHKEVEAIPAAHTYGEFTVTQEPTCYSTGAKTATCTVCGHEHTEWIDMVPHKYENGECVFCHATMPEGYVAPSDDRTEITETAGSETENTDNQTTEPETADNQAAEPENTDNQTAETTAPEQQGVEPAAEAAPVNTVTITFDGNGATGGSMEPQAFAEGSVQALSANAFTRDGYLFLGWDVAADGSAMGEDRFLDGEAVELNADVTLYAQWREINADVETQQTEASAETVSSFENVLNAQGLTEIDPSAMVVQNVTPLNENGERMSNEEVAARGGVIFDMPVPDTYEEGHEIEVYHQNSETGEWERVTTYTVQGDKVIVCLKHFSPVVTLDRTALGGTLSTNETPMLGAAGDPVTVKFDKNGGTGSDMSDQVLQSGNKEPLSENTYERSLYAFSGWNTKADKSGKHFENKESVSAEDFADYNSLVTLYAEWDRIVVRFNNNGGTGSMTAQEINETPEPLKKNTFTRTGYTYAGWDTDSSGQGKHFYDEQSVSTTDITAPTTLYAQWKKNINIIYQSNQSSGSSSEGYYAEPTKHPGTTVTIKSFEETGITQKANRTFVEWNTESDGSGTVYKPGDTLTLTESSDATITLYAQWGFEVSFEPNGAEGTSYTENATENKDFEIPENQFTRDGDKYEFLGWNTTETGAGGKAYGDKATIPGSEMTGPFPLFAQWGKIYTVVFHGNGGKATDDTTTKTQKIKEADFTAAGTTGVALAANPFTYTKDGVTQAFAGWSTSATGTAAYQDKDPVKENVFTDQTLELYALWAEPITLTYDPGIAAGDKKTQSVPKNTEITLTSVDELFEVPNYYSFENWLVKDSEPAVEYEDGANVTLTKNTTLEAQWKRDQVTLTLDANDKTAPATPTKKEIEIDKALAYTLPTAESLGFTYPNRTFIGWNTVREPSEDNPGTKYGDGEKLPATATGKNLTLYAQWGYAVTFVKGSEDATGEMDLQSFEFNKEFSLNPNEFARTNYEFNGWKDENDQSYSDEQSVKFDKSHTLTAQWKQVKYAVEYNPNGGGGTMDDDNVTVGQNVALKECTFNPKPGMIFAGWSEVADPSDADKIYAAGEKYLPEDDTTLYAIWKDIVKVYYYPGNGDGTYKTQEMPKDTETALWKYDSTELGYTAPSGQTFAYWQDMDVASEYYFNGEKVALSKDTRLEAVWADTVKITYHANGGTVTVRNSSGTTTKESTDQSAPKDMPYTLYTAEALVLKRDGYEFEGWMSTASGSTIKYTDGQTIDEGFSQNTTIYAKWKRVKIADTVTISGSTTGSDPNAIWGETLTATVVDPVLKTGFIYTWKVGDEEVQTGESNTLEVKPEYYGKDITCTVTHPQAENEVVSNIKTVGVYAVVEDDELRIVNSRAKYPGLYYEVPLIFGAMPGTTYYKDGKAATVPESAASGTFEITEPGVYVFGDTTYVATQWWTIGYSSSNGSGDNSGSGTTTMKRGSTTLSGSTRIKSGDVTLLEPYNTINGYSNVWLVRDGSGITDITLTVRPSSGSYGHVSRNGSGFSSSNAERIISLGTIDEPELYEVIYNKSSSSPRTGDMSNLGLWSALCLVSFVGVTGILTSARKRKNRG